MIDPALTWVYFPTAVALGAFHALEPGHAKTLTAAYLIGIKGTKWDALTLGLSVAVTHSVVVLLLAAGALWFGEEAFSDQATRLLQLASAVIVIGLGIWMLMRRLRLPKVHHHDDHHDHSHLSDDEHARLHAATIPEYAKRGERPTFLQIIAFGSAGGMIPCPASVTVMLLALSVGKAGFGLLAVAGFSLGLAITLVGVGLTIVAGLSHIEKSGHLFWVSQNAPVISAVIVILSGFAALAFIA